jgi:hypothetical protein
MERRYKKATPRTAEEREAVFIGYEARLEERFAGSESELERRLLAAMSLATADLADDALSPKSRRRYEAKREQIWAGVNKPFLAALIMAEHDAAREARQAEERQRAADEQAALDRARDIEFAKYRAEHAGEPIPPPPRRVGRLLRTTEINSAGILAELGDREIEFLAKGTCADGATATLYRVPETSIHVLDTNGDPVWRQNCSLQEWIDTLDFYGLSAVVKW